MLNQPGPISLGLKVFCNFISETLFWEKIITSRTVGIYKIIQNKERKPKSRVLVPPFLNVEKDFEAGQPVIT